MAYTEKGVYYQTDYNEDADILEDMKKMAESIDEVVENSEASADEQYVKKVAGKGLSTNDYDDTEQGKVQANTQARHTHSNKSILDGTTASFTTEKDDKLANLENYDDSELRDEIGDNTTNIETLQAENAKLQTQVNTLKEITNQMPQVSDSGEEAYLADTIKAPFTEFEVKGHSEQETTEGRQLFKPIASKTKDGITFTNNGDGRYTLNGTATANTSFYVAVDYIAGTYTLSVNNNQTAASSNYILMETTEGRKTVVMNEINKKETFATGNITAIVVVVGNGTTFNNFVIKPMLEAGSTAHEWEPYTGRTSLTKPIIRTAC